MLQPIHECGEEVPAAEARLQFPLIVCIETLGTSFECCGVVFSSFLGQDGCLQVPVALMLVGLSCETVVATGPVPCRRDDLITRGCLVFRPVVVPRRPAQGRECLAMMSERERRDPVPAKLVPRFVRTRSEKLTPWYGPPQIRSLRITRSCVSSATSLERQRRWGRSSGVLVSSVAPPWHGRTDCCIRPTSRSVEVLYHCFRRLPFAR